MSREESRKAYREYERYKRRRALKALFERNSIDDEFKELALVKRLFYWLKTCICLLFNKTNGTYLKESIYILSYDETSCMDCYSWQACWVERGLFKNWQVCVSSDGN